MLQEVLLSASRLPLLFRGDAMRPSSMYAILVISLPMLVVLAIKVRSGMRLSTACVWAILGVYAAWAAGLLFEPTVRAADPHFADGVRRWINLIPFATISSQLQSSSGVARVQLIGNIGLLLPLGLLGPIVMPSLRRVRRLGLVALGGALTIELAQLIGTRFWFMDRSVDVDDVILNVAGALVGWLLWRAMSSVRVRQSRSSCADAPTA